MLNTIINRFHELIGPFKSKRTSNNSDILHLLSKTVQPRSFVNKEILLNDIHTIIDKTGLYTSYDTEVFALPSSHHVIVVGNVQQGNTPTRDPRFKHAEKLYPLQDNQEFIFSYTYAQRRDKADIIDDGQADLLGKLQGQGLGTEIMESIHRQAVKDGYKYVIGMHLSTRLVRYFSTTKDYRVRMDQLPIDIQDYLTDSDDPTKHKTTVVLLDKINIISQ